VRLAYPDADLLIVDDASPDGTADLADALNESLGQIAVLRRSARQGWAPRIEPAAPRSIVAPTSACRWTPTCRMTPPSCPR
jgi:hypothetical protein